MKYYLIAIMGIIVTFLFGIVVKEELKIPEFIAYIGIIASWIKLLDWARGKAKK